MLLAPSLAAVGQKEIAVKLYSHATLFDARTLLGYDEPASEIVAFGGLAPALFFQNENGLYQEFELSRVYYKNVEEGSDPYEKSSLSLRYEAGFSLEKKRATNMQLRFGLSLRGYTYSYSNFTGGFDGYPIDQDGVGWIISMTPHLELNIIENLFLDFSPYLDIANFGVRREFDYNPNFVDEQVDSIDFLFAAFKPRLRAGLGWHF